MNLDLSVISRETFDIGDMRAMRDMKDMKNMKDVGDTRAMERLVTT